MSAIAADGFVAKKSIENEVFDKLMQAGAVAFRTPCEIDEFAMDLPEPARKIQCVTASSPRAQEALRRIFN